MKYSWFTPAALVLLIASSVALAETAVSNLSGKSAKNPSLSVYVNGTNAKVTSEEYRFVMEGFDISTGSQHFINEDCKWVIEYKKGRYLKQYNVYEKDVQAEYFSCAPGGKSPLAGSYYTPSLGKSGKTFHCTKNCGVNPFRALVFEQIDEGN